MSSGSQIVTIKQSQANGSSTARRVLISFLCLFLVFGGLFEPRMKFPLSNVHHEGRDEDRVPADDMKEE
jgi:hypothetical protein